MRTFVAIFLHVFCNIWKHGDMLTNTVVPAIWGHREKTLKCPNIAGVSIMEGHLIWNESEVKFVVVLILNRFSYRLASSLLY